MAGAETGGGDGWFHHTAHKPRVSCDGLGSQQAGIVEASSRRNNGFSWNKYSSLSAWENKKIRMSLTIHSKEQQQIDFRRGGRFHECPKAVASQLGVDNCHLHRLLRLCGLPVCTETGTGMQVRLPLLQRG